MGLGSIFPLIPYFVQEQNAHVAWLGAIISVQYVALTIGAQFFGWLCDRRDPKQVMLLVLGADVVLFFLSGVANSVVLMLLVRAGAGFFTPMPIGTAWIGICVPDDEKAKAFHASTLAILSGFILGTALGGLTGSLFYACVGSAAIAFAALVVIALGAPPSPPAAAQQQQRRAAASEASAEDTRTAGICNMAAEVEGEEQGGDGKPRGVRKVLSTFEWRAAALIAYNVGQEGSCAGPVAAYLFSTRFGYSERQTGWVFCGIVTCLLIVNVTMMDRINKMASALPRVLILAALETPAYVGMLALFGYDAATGSLPAHADIVFIVLAICLFAFNAMLHPTSFDLGSIYADRWGQNCQGTVLGAQNSLFSLGQAVGPIVSAALLSVNTYWCFVFMFTGLVAVFVANGIVWQRELRAAAAEKERKEVGGRDLTAAAGAVKAEAGTAAVADDRSTAVVAVAVAVAGESAAVSSETEL
eukprot:g2848.t1